MGDNKVHFRIRFKNWYWTKRAWRHMMSKSNGIFSHEYSSYDLALIAIESTENDIKSAKKKQIEVFNIHRTEIPEHIPREQHVRYTSTEKITD